jgi:hypothetical protein
MPDFPHSFEEALRALARWFESDGVPYTTVGGLAVSLLGRPRATQDIDVVVWLGERPWESFVRAGEGHGFEGRIGDVLEFAARSRVILLRHAASGISVDVSCGALPFELEMVERAQTLEDRQTGESAEAEARKLNVFYSRQTARGLWGKS